LKQEVTFTLGMGIDRLRADDPAPERRQNASPTPADRRSGPAPNTGRIKTLVKDVFLTRLKLGENLCMIAKTR
jgi:hypothetical protein